MDRIGIIVYSRTGTARAAAERLAASSGWPIHEIRDAEPRSGLSGDARCIIDNLFRRNPDIRYDGPTLDGFDHVVLIAPVWLRSLAAPMRTFLKLQGGLIKGYSVIGVMSGYGGFRAVDDIVALTGSQPRSILLLKQYDVLAGVCDAALRRFEKQTLAASRALRRDDPELSIVD